MGVLDAQDLSSLSNSFSKGETPGPRIPPGRTALSGFFEPFSRFEPKTTQQKLEPFLVFVPNPRTLRGKIEGRARKLEPFVASSPTRKKLLYPSDAKWLCATKLIWQSRSRGFKLVCEFRET